MTINRRQDGARRGGGDGTVSFLFETITGEGGGHSHTGEIAAGLILTRKAPPTEQRGLFLSAGLLFAY